jgi:glutaminyl-peptide cyclotransferase
MNALAVKSNESGVSSARATAANLTSPRSVGILALLLIASGSGIVAYFQNRQRDEMPPTNQQAWKIPAGISADRSYAYLKQICDLGPRPSGSEGMRRQQEMLREFFQQQGAVVEFQTFQARDPRSGQPVEMKNLIARWFPDQPQRVLVCAHYDTRPFPDRDPVRPQGIFIGANDGGSGTAVLMELSHHLATLSGKLGIDLILFDGEELVYRDQVDPYFLGSTHFAQQYAAKQLPGQYGAGVLLDMVGDRELSIFYEHNSLRYAKDVCREVWAGAKRLGIDAFVPIARHEIRDDHLPLNTIGRIPVADVIDFDYPSPRSRGLSYWHTEGDTPDKCSGVSLAAVTAVVYEWLKFRSGATR